MSWEQVKYLEDKMNQNNEQTHTILLENIVDEALFYAIDYKEKGQDSPVYICKDKLHKAYRTWYLLNDKTLWKEALQFAQEDLSFGVALDKLERCEPIETPSNYKIPTDLYYKGTPEIKERLMNEDGDLHFLFAEGFLSTDIVDPAEIKATYFDTNRTDCDTSYPEIIYSVYGDSFNDSYEEALNLFNKNSFWKKAGWYFDNQTWLSGLFSAISEKDLVKQKTIIFQEESLRKSYYDFNGGNGGGWLHYDKQAWSEQVSEGRILILRITSTVSCVCEDTYTSALATATIKGPTDYSASADHGHYTYSKENVWSTRNYDTYFFQETDPLLSGNFQIGFYCIFSSLKTAKYKGEQTIYYMEL